MSREVEMNLDRLESQFAAVTKERDDYRHGWEGRNRIIQIYREKLGCKDGESGFDAVDALTKERDELREALRDLCSNPLCGHCGITRTASIDIMIDCKWDRARALLDGGR